MRLAPLDEWIQFASTLDPYQQLILVGLLDMDPSLSPTSIGVSSIVGENKVFHTKLWAERNFRKALRVYCSFCNSAAGAFGGGVKETQDAIKKLAPLLAGAAGLSLGGAVGFSFWALGFSLQQWCHLNAMQQLDGTGEYLVYVDICSDSDFPPGPDSEIRIPGKFVITYVPPIQETVKDLRYPLPVHKLVIHEPAEVRGRFYPEPPCDLDAKVCRFYAPSSSHHISFSDIATKRKVEGEVKSGQVSAECNELLDFVGAGNTFTSI